MLNTSKYKEVVNFLIKNECGNIKHGTKTFFEHCVNVSIVLHDWKCSDELILAGLLHNVYGNKNFDPYLNLQPDTIIHLVGYRVNEIITKFKYFSNDMLIPKETEDLDLSFLHFANEIEPFYANLSNENKKEMIVIAEKIRTTYKSTGVWTKEIFELFNQFNKF